jgi:hypothetical protein
MSKDRDFTVHREYQKKVRKCKKNILLCIVHDVYMYVRTNKKINNWSSFLGNLRINAVVG